MKVFVFVAGLFTLAVLVALPAPAQEPEPPMPVVEPKPDPAPATRAQKRKLDRIIPVVQMCERELGDVRVHPTSRRYRHDTAAFAGWAINLWRGRHHRYCGLMNRLNAYPPAAIEYVFARLGADDVAIALDVSDDEGGGPQCVRSKNGQYLGCFQMGDWARSTYGHGLTALRQAWAAFRYRVNARGWCSGWSATANVCPGAIR